MRAMRLISVIALAAATVARASAQTYPSGPVRIIVGTGPGASPDLLCRVLAEHLSRLWGEQVIVLNQPGGGGALAIRGAGNAPADGSTLYFALASNFIALPQLRAALPFDVGREFVPIGYVGEHPMLIAASPALGVSTLPELAVLARRRPGELNVAAGNPGSLLHLSAAWLRKAIRADMTLIHYAGAPQSMADVLGGRVHVLVDALSGLAGAVQSGTIKPLAVASERRLEDWPQLPTVAETFPGFVALGWFALMAPPKTPQPIARKASEGLRAALAQPTLQKRFADLGTYLRPMSGPELGAFIAAQQRLWEPIIADVGAAN